MREKLELLLEVLQTRSRISSKATPMLARPLEIDKRLPRDSAGFLVEHSVMRPHGTKVVGDSVTRR